MLLLLQEKLKIMTVFKQHYLLSTKIVLYVNKLAHILVFTLQPLFIMLEATLELLTTALLELLLPTLETSIDFQVSLTILLSTVLCIAIPFQLPCSLLLN